MTKESLSALSKQDVIIPQSGHNYTKLQVREVQSAIEKGLTLYKSKMEIFAVLKNVDQNVVNLVWQKLEQNNPRFFTAYLIRLAVIKQIKVFQQLVVEQNAMKAKQGTSSRQIEAMGIKTQMQQMGGNASLDTTPTSSQSATLMNPSYGTTMGTQGFPNVMSQGASQYRGTQNIMGSQGNMAYGSGATDAHMMRSGSTPPSSGSSGGMQMGFGAPQQNTGGAPTGNAQFSPQMMQQLPPQMIQQLRQMQMSQFPMGFQQQIGATAGMGGFQQPMSMPNQSPHMSTGVPSPHGSTAGQFQMPQFQNPQSYSGYPSSMVAGMGGGTAGTGAGGLPQHMMGAAQGGAFGGLPQTQKPHMSDSGGMMSGMGGTGGGMPSTSPQQNAMMFSQSMSNAPNASSSSVPQQSISGAQSGAVIKNNSSDHTHKPPPSTSNNILDSYDTADDNEIDTLLDDSIFD